MTAKRFMIICDDNIEFIMQTKLLLPIYDNKERLSLKTCCDLLNELNEDKNDLTTALQLAIDKNEQLKKELHLMHMRIMFSTVQSFKGDVSKRYKYSEETDTIYDAANHYGQYDKILDKKEIVMLLNEYETILNEKGDME